MTINAAIPREERRYRDDAAHGVSLAFSPDGRVLGVGTGIYEDSIRFFDARTGARLGVLRGHSDALGSVHFSPDGRTVTVGGLQDGTLRFWDTATGELARTVQRGRDEVWLAGYLPDGREILTYGGFGGRGLQLSRCRSPRLTRVIATAAGPDPPQCAASPVRTLP